MQALSETLPKYSTKDFLVVSRKDEKGSWTGEVYAKRDFEPFEILLAPHSSQIKDSHMMASAHAVVNLPLGGRGAHPESQGLALDGRCRNLMASKGSLDDSEHSGSLFWLITRSCDPAEVNLDQESMTWEQHIKVNISGPAFIAFIFLFYIRYMFILLLKTGPASKKRKLAPVEWAPSELPSIPILTNKKALPKHTKLCVFLAEVVKKANKESNAKV